MSILLIFLVHHLLNFFKSTLTVPKIKDLVNTPILKYENMYNIIKNDSMCTKLNEYDLLPSSNPTQMKDELKSFLKKQLNVSSNTTEISALDSSFSSDTGSSYAIFK